MATVSAGGTILPLFGGLSYPSSKHCPWIYAKESGWINADAFLEWFMGGEARTRTANNKKELETRLMIYDGHLSHDDYTITNLVRGTRVTILNFLLHTIDLLQPLDVAA